MKKTTIITAFLMLLSFGFVSAHPGRTDAKGGHTNANTGKYHTHDKVKKAKKVVRKAKKKTIKKKVKKKAKKTAKKKTKKATKKKKKK